MIEQPWLGSNGSPGKDGSSRERAARRADRLIRKRRQPINQRASPTGTATTAAQSPALTRPGKCRAARMPDIFARMSCGADAGSADGVDARDHVALRTGSPRSTIVSIMPSSSAKQKQSPDGMSSQRVGCVSTAPGDDAGMAQHVQHAAPGDAHGLGARRAAAAELGGDEDLAHLLGGGVVHADRVDLEHLHRLGRRERLDRGEGLAPPAPCRAGCGRRRRAGSRASCRRNGSRARCRRAAAARAGNSRRSSPSPCRPAGPGKLRFRLPLSIGEVRVPARKAGIVHRRHDDDRAADVVRHRACARGRTAPAAPHTRRRGCRR